MESMSAPPSPPNDSSSSTHNLSWAQVYLSLSLSLSLSFFFIYLINIFWLFEDISERSEVHRIAFGRWRIVSREPPIHSGTFPPPPPLPPPPRHLSPLPSSLLHLSSNISLWVIATPRVHALRMPHCHHRPRGRSRCIPLAIIQICLHVKSMIVLISIFLFILYFFSFYFVFLSFCSSYFIYLFWIQFNIPDVSHLPMENEQMFEYTADPGISLLFFPPIFPFLSFILFVIFFLIFIFSCCVQQINWFRILRLPRIFGCPIPGIRQVFCDTKEWKNQYASLFSPLSSLSSLSSLPPSHPSSHLPLIHRSFFIFNSRVHSRWERAHRERISKRKLSDVLLSADVRWRHQYSAEFSTSFWSLAETDLEFSQKEFCKAHHRKRMVWSRLLSSLPSALPSSLPSSPPSFFFSSSLLFLNAGLETLPKYGRWSKSHLPFTSTARPSRKCKYSRADSQRMWWRVITYQIQLRNEASIPIW